MSELLETSPLTVGRDAIADKDDTILASVRRSGFALGVRPRSLAVLAPSGQPLWRMRIGRLRTPKRFWIEVTEPGGARTGVIRTERLSLTRVRYVFSAADGARIAQGECTDRSKYGQVLTTSKHEFKDAAGKRVATSIYRIGRAPQQLRFDSAASRELRMLLISLVITLPNRKLRTSARVSPLLTPEPTGGGSNLLDATALTLHRDRLLDSAGTELAAIREPAIPIGRALGRLMSTNRGLGPHTFDVLLPSSLPLFRIDKSGWVRRHAITVTAPDGRSVATITRATLGKTSGYSVTEASGLLIGRIDQVAPLSQEYSVRDADGAEVAALNRAIAVDEPWTIGFAAECGEALRMVTIAFAVVQDLRLDL